MRSLRPHVEGRRLLAVVPHHPVARRALPAPHRRAIAGRAVTRLERRGKYQRFALDDGTTLIAHFRLDGDWLVAPGDAPLHPCARVSLSLDDGARVSLVDPRALASVTWHRAGDDPLAALGPEPFDPTLDASAFRAALRTRRTAIKLALLDQHLLAGVGNIYAAEALWHAALHPAVPAGALGPSRAERLLDGIRLALARGLDEPGRHVPSLVAPVDAGRGHALMVYDREGQACVRCGGTIRRIVQGGRSTYYCAACQRR